jgi:enoyl-CoA hydratase/3-hydroxyacyl-CoA dehydrogenase
MSHPSSFESINFEKELASGIAWIVLKAGSRGMSTITSKTMEEMRRALEIAEEDEEIRVLGIMGETEKAFSAGADISTFQSSTSVRTGESSIRGQEIFKRFENFPKPVIAAICGYCLGGGLELAMACDFRLASANAQLGLPEINLGLLPGWGGTQRMTKILGTAKAKELIMSGERISAEEAFKIGLVSKVFPVDSFDSQVREFASKLAQKPPIALNLAKKAINFASAASSGEAGFELEARSFAIAMQTEDAREGMEAFFEKRKPVFKGK